MAVSNSMVDRRAVARFMATFGQAMPDFKVWKRSEVPEQWRHVCPQQRAEAARRFASGARLSSAEII